MEKVEQGFIDSLIGKEVRILTPHNLEFTGKLVAATDRCYFLETRGNRIVHGVMTQSGEPYRRMVDRGPGTMLEPIASVWATSSPGLTD